MSRRGKDGQVRRAQPAKAAAWKTAVDEGIGEQLVDWVIEYPFAHWRYEPGEIPIYRPCACGAELRADRLDLVREHLLGRGVFNAHCGVFRIRDS